MGAVSRVLLFLAACLGCARPALAQGLQVVYMTDPAPTFVDGAETAQPYVVGFKGPGEPEPATPHRTMVLRHANGTAYRCYLPPVEGHEVGGEGADGGSSGVSQELSTADEASLLPQKTPTELLEALRDHCYYRVEGWWHYELCYQKAVRQYHKGANDALEAQYVLGRWEPEQEQQDADAVQVDSADVSGATPYVAHRYTGGDACELTGQARSVEVRFTCARGAADTLLTSIREPSSCAYVVTIATPRLCKHPGFQAAPREAALIQCHRVSEEEEAQCGGGGGGEHTAAAAAAAGEAAAAAAAAPGDVAAEGGVEWEEEPYAYGDAEAGLPAGGGDDADDPYADLEEPAGGGGGGGDADDPYADPDDLLHDEL